MALTLALFPNARPLRIPIYISVKFYLLILIALLVQRLDHWLYFKCNQCLNLMLIRPLQFRTLHIVKLSQAQLYQSKDAIRWQVRWCIVLLTGAIFFNSCIHMCTTLHIIIMLCAMYETWFRLIVKVEMQEKQRKLLSMIQ